MKDDDATGILYWFKQQMKEDNEETTCWLCGFNYDNKLSKCPRCGEENSERARV